jgi:putative ABC transport system substrate-binding protein
MRINPDCLWAMRRRDVIKVIAGSAAAWPLAVNAQQPSATRRLGFLGIGLENDPFAKANASAFTEALDRLGWKEGANLHIDWRWYGADAALAGRQAIELLALKPDVVFAGGNPAVEAFQRQDKSIPMVFALVSDPVGMHYVDSLSRPGGNTTGFASYDPPIYTKQLQLFTQISPAATTVAALYNPETATYAGQMLRAMEAGAKSLGVSLRDAPCRDDAGIETVMAAVARDGGGGVLALGDIFNLQHRQTIMALAFKYRIPTVVPARQMLEAGGLLAYSIDIPDLFRSAATYVDRILKGAKPTDLPVQTPTKFELRVNLKTAKTLGIIVSDRLLATADEVIE